MAFFKKISYQKLEKIYLKTLKEKEELQYQIKQAIKYVKKNCQHKIDCNQLLCILENKTKVQKNQIGNALKCLRKTQNLTQKQLADKLDITRQAISEWERGICTPSVKVFIKIDQMFDVDLNDLL